MSKNGDAIGPVDKPVALFMPDYDNITTLRELKDVLASFEFMLVVEGELKPDLDSLLKRGLIKKVDP